MILLTKERYTELLNAETTLRLLGASGVDNWQWYGDALYPEGEKDINDRKLENAEQADKENQEVIDGFASPKALAIPKEQVLVLPEQTDFFSQPVRIVPIKENNAAKSCLLEG